jgi:hypothetical protein
LREAARKEDDRYEPRKVSISTIPSEAAVTEEYSSEVAGLEGQSPAYHSNVQSPGFGLESGNMAGAAYSDEMMAMGAMGSYGGCGALTSMSIWSMYAMSPMAFQGPWGYPYMMPEAVGAGRQKGSRGQKAQRTGGKKNGDSQKTKGSASAAAASAQSREGNETTVMLRNIPNRYDQETLLRLLDEGPPGEGPRVGFLKRYDFVYLPMDFRNKVNLGYAFINFLTHADAMEFKGLMTQFSGWGCDSNKVCEVTWAHPHQGKDEHVERYRNSPVMHESMPEAFKPMIFENGDRKPFPPPTKAIRAPKMRPAGHERASVASQTPTSPIAE